METSLKTIKYRLKKLLEKLNWKSEQIAEKNQTMLKLSGLIQLRQTINEFQDLNLFDNYANFLKTSVIFTTGDDEMTVQHSAGSAVIHNLTSLKTLSENFLNILNKVLPEEDKNSVNIKLPPVDDFNQLSEVSRKIHIALSQVLYSDEIKGQTKIVSVENGSIWFNVFVGSTALTLVASLAWSAAVIYKKMQEGKLLAEQVRGLKVKNDSLQDILNAQRAETELMIEAEAEHINSEHFKKNAPENIERIKNSITIFAELIGKGAEIHPALIAPEDVSNLFPDTKNLIGLESKIKRITNTTNAA